MRLFEAFRRNRLERPDSPAFLISSGDRSLPISWRTFTDDIAVVSWIVRTKSPGGTIGLLGENSYEWMVSHAACVFSGATVVPLDTNLSEDEIIGRMRQVGAAVLVHSALYADKAHAVAKRMPGLATGSMGSRKTDFLLDAGRKAIGCGLKTLWNREGPDENRVSMIVFTSGTTSEPRGVELTLRSLAVSCEAWAAALEMAPSDRSLMLLPLHHVFGLCATYLMLSQGVALGVCPDFRRIYDAVVRFRADFLCLVPALADILAARIDRSWKSAEDALGSPLNWVLTGGAPLPRRTYERMAALGIKTISAYGLTETAALYSVAPTTGEVRACSAGKVAAHPEVETMVSESGELLIRGPNVMKGYFGMPEKTSAAIDADGWFHTGDIGRIDDAGFVWIDGRLSRTIVLSSGKKVAPEELEERLTAIPGVREALVTGEGETRAIRAEIYASVSEETVRRAVGAMNLLLPVYKRVSEIVVRAEPFPRTSSGKICIRERASK